MGDFLKDDDVKNGDEQDEEWAFTRCKSFEICFGLVEAPSSQPELPETVHGNPILKSKIIKVLLDFKQTFCRQVRKEPANLPPFELHLAPFEKWTTSRANCGRPRPLGPEKQRELKIQMETMQAVDVIEHSTALHYSQVHMVPKKPRG